MAPPTARRTRSSYTQLKQHYELSLQQVLNDNSDMPLEGKIHLPGLNNPCFHPAAEAGIKSSFELFNTSVATFRRVATELKQSALAQGATAEVAEIDEQLNEILVMALRAMRK